MHSLHLPRGRHLAHALARSPSVAGLSLHPSPALQEHSLADGDLLAGSCPLEVFVSSMPKESAGLGPHPHSSVPGPPS